MPGGTLVEMRLKGLIYKSIAVLLICLFSFFLTISIARAEDVVTSETTPAPEESVDQQQEPTPEPEPENEAVVQSEPEPEPVVNELVTNGGDDSSYRIPLTVPIIYDGVEYTDVYATTNSVITFGQPDGTYWQYPNTPSVSIESRDWWALPSHNPDMHFIIRTSDGGFQVDGAYLPYGTMQGEITNIVITAQILNDGTVDYTYTVNGPLYGGERTGARLNDGTVVPLEEAGIEQVEEPVVLEPTPAEPTPEPTPEPEPIPEPEQPIEPEPEEPTPPEPPVEPSDPEPSEPSEPVQPEPEPQPEPSNPQPEPQPEPQQPEPPVEPEPQPEPEEPEPEPELEEPEPPIEEEVDPEPEIPQDPEPLPEEEDLGEGSENTPEPKDPDTNDIDQESPEEEQPVSPVEPTNPQTPINSPVETIVLPNGVELPAEIAQALELVSDSPIELLNNILENPAEALKALLNVGADMSPEKREEAQIVVIAAIIVGQIMSTVAAAVQMSQARRM